MVATPEGTSESFRQAEEKAKKAPISSVIVWDKCGGSAAGHIAIVTKTRVGRADFEAKIEETFGTNSSGFQRIIAIFQPVGRPR